MLSLKGIEMVNTLGDICIGNDQTPAQNPVLGYSSII